MEKMQDAPGFLIDGFPANMKQAEIFQAKVQAPHKIIYLDVPEAVMTPRLKDGLNFNDQDDTIKKRIFTYLENIQPSIEQIIKKWPTSSKTVSFTYYSFYLFLSFFCYILENVSDEDIDMISNIIYHGRAYKFHQHLLWDISITEIIA